MGLHVNRNLALETPSALALRMQPQADADPRAELAAQFIPAGARVLELGRGAVRCCRTAAAIRPRTRCHYSTCDLDGGDFPTKAAAEADIIVMLGALETVADVESFFTHLRFCKRDVLLSYQRDRSRRRRDRAPASPIISASTISRCCSTATASASNAPTPIDDAQVLMRLTPTERLQAGRRLQRRGDLRQRCRQSRRPPRLPHDQRAAAGRGRGASSDLRHAGIRRATNTIWSCSASATACSSRCSATTCSTSSRAPRPRSAFSARNTAN